MREVTLKELLTLPENTLFTQYGPLWLKGKSLNDNDFFYEQITPTHRGPGEPADFDMGTSRWGEFDDEALFIVYDADDILSLITRLTANAN